MIGVCFFKDLVEESTVFIYKSLFIKEFIESRGNVLLITSPRRWGKSINMDMIETFFEIEGKNLLKTQTCNYKLFQGDLSSGNLEEPLSVVKQSKIMEDYQGEYPVISIDFKDIKAVNYQGIVESSQKKVLIMYENLY